MESSDEEIGKEKNKLNKHVRLSAKHAAAAKASSERIAELEERNAKKSKKQKKSEGEAEVGKDVGGGPNDKDDDADKDNGNGNGDGPRTRADNNRASVIASA